MDNNRKCLNCGEDLKTGRSDRKYCDAQCRSNSNNQNLRETEKELLRINAILRKNRTLLKQLNPIGKTTIRKEVLTVQGFNFQYFTNIYTPKNGNTYYFCYEYGYLFVPDDKLVIVNYQNYMAALFN